MSCTRSRSSVGGISSGGSTGTPRGADLGGPIVCGGGIGSSNTVYVGNLSYHTSWQDLKDLCKEVGTVLHADVMMEDDGRSKGCGLVKFATASEARRAIAELHDTELDGRKIFVREDRETAGGPGCKLYVGNLSPGTTWMDLKDLFREAVRARTVHTHTAHSTRTRTWHAHAQACVHVHAATAPPEQPQSIPRKCLPHAHAT